MNKTLIVIALLTFLCTSQAITVEGLIHFKKWRDTHRKIYHNENENLYRQLVFMENMKKIRKHNEESNQTYVTSINQFSDLTQEEFAFKYLMNEQIDTPQENLEQETHILQAPIYAESIDWREKGAVSSVKDQGQCGSCWTFSATGLMESFHYIKTKTMTNFSQQQLLNCANYRCGYHSRGCVGGWPQEAIHFASKYGILTANQLPYTASIGDCNIYYNTNGFKPKSYARVAPSTEGLKAALSYSPVSVLIDARNLKFYSSGIYNSCNPQNIALNHAVLVVGYDSRGNWIVKNSWGTGWGQSGYFYVAPNNTCGILQSMYLITA